MGEQYSGKPTALFFGTNRRKHNPCPFFQDNYSETPLSGRHTAEDKTPFFNKPGNSKVQGNVAHGGGARCNSPGHIKKPCQFNRRATHIGGGLVGIGGIPGGIRGADTGSGKFILLISISSIIIIIIIIRHIQAASQEWLRHTAAT